MTFGSLFAGIGGLDLGLERAGMTCKWQVEIDDYARRVLAKNWPDVRRHDDIRTFPPEGDWSVDLIAGGFPCQDISYAGKGAGLEGERSGLFYEAARVVREVGPRYVLLENVSALLTRGLDAVLGTLASLGFDAEWHCIPAAAVGAPHIRDRVFIVAYPCGQGGTGLVKSLHPCPPGPWGGRREASMFAGNPFEPGDRWPQPLIRRVDDGISARVDRLRGLGNAVVPQVAELIGRAIMEGER